MYIRRIVKTNGALLVTIPKKFADRLDLQQFDYVKVELVETSTGYGNSRTCRRQKGKLL